MIFLFLRRILPTLFLDGLAIATETAFLRISGFICDGTAIMSLRRYIVWALKNHPSTEMARMILVVTVFKVSLS
jgi:hypothetical protein